MDVHQARTVSAVAASSDDGNFSPAHGFHAVFSDMVSDMVNSADDHDPRQQPEPAAKRTW